MLFSWPACMLHTRASLRPLGTLCEKAVQRPQWAHPSVTTPINGNTHFSNTHCIKNTVFNAVFLLWFLLLPPACMGWGSGNYRREHCHGRVVRRAAFCATTRFSYVGLMAPCAAAQLEYPKGWPCYIIVMVKCTNMDADPCTLWCLSKVHNRHLVHSQHLQLISVLCWKFQ